jgi:hypothetical protein
VPAEGHVPRNRAELMTRRVLEVAIAATAGLAQAAVAAQDRREVVVVESAAGMFVRAWIEARSVVEETVARTKPWTPRTWAFAGVASWDWLGQGVIRESSASAQLLSGGSATSALELLWSAHI